MEWNKFRITSTVFILLLLLLMWDEYRDIDKKDCECTPDKKDKVLKKIIQTEESSLSTKMIKSCKSGIMTGCLAGGLSGGLTGAIASGAIFGITNPIIVYISESKK